MVKLNRRRDRRGNILVLSAVGMIVMMAMLAFAIDIGYLCVARDELQRSADAAALAATWELVDPGSFLGTGGGNAVRGNARNTAGQYAGLNRVLRESPGLSAEDVDIGFLANPSDPSDSLDLSGTLVPNAVRVRVRRSADQNGEVPFFVARVLGFEGMATQAEATAALLFNFRGFQMPGDGSNLEIIPLALDEETWNNMLAGIGEDLLSYGEDHRIRPGNDGLIEMNLYPSDVGEPGNRGTLDIGSNNNSTADIERQILTGISESDLDHHGGKLEFDENDELDLDGDTGISAAVKDELTSIIGKKRIIPIFTRVVNPGDNATYTINKFAGIRIMEVKLTGAPSQKRVIIQPAEIISKGGIHDSGTAKTFFVYSPVWLCR